MSTMARLSKYPMKRSLTMMSNSLSISSSALVNMTMSSLSSFSVMSSIPRPLGRYITYQSFSSRLILLWLRLNSSI